ncbi:ribosomal L28e protein family-domain-containing protein [Blastocladiella britannica]|nr:ribosomal L28e protein family-domain-containing protein [Blastocladiella britannica]
MQNDEVIWGIIKNQFCSYKIKTITQQFCRNDYNVTGLCTRQNCPLANSRYATVREVNGVCYLYMKTVERAHTPDRMWERIKLPKNYLQALELIDSELEFWPSFLKHKCKQRLTKITQYLIKMRKLRVKANTTKLVPIKKKIDRRELRREAKAEVAARLDKAIASELVERLKAGTYDDVILNAKQSVWKKLLESDKVEVEEDQSESEDEEEEAMGDQFVEYEDDEEEYGRREAVEASDSDGSDVEDLMNASEISGSEYSEASDSDDDAMDADVPPPPRKVASQKPAAAASSAASSSARAGKRAPRPKRSGKPARGGSGGGVELEYEHEAAAPRAMEEAW